MKRKVLATLIKSASLCFALYSSSVQAESLIDIFNLAANNDPEIREARANFDATHTNIAQGRSQLLPSVTLTADTGRSANGPETTFSISDDFSTKGYGFDIRQNLINFEAWYQFQGIKKNDLAAAANLASAEQQLILRVATAYFNVLRSVDNLSSFQAQLDASERVLEQTSQRFEVGLLPITDVYESQSNFDLARVNLLVEENNLNQGYEALEAITGLPYSELDTLSDQFPIIPIQPAGMDEWVALAEDNNLAVKAAEFQYESQDENAKAAKAAMFPTVGLTARYGWSESGTQFTFFDSPASENASVQVSLSAPQQDLVTS